MTLEMLRSERTLNAANLLTVMRLALLPVIVWRFSEGDRLGALAVYVVSMLTDIADGICARRFNQVTSVGKLLDPLADKLTLLALLALFTADGQIPGWVLSVMLGKELLLVLGSGFALRRGVVVHALPIGKASTLCFVVSMTLRFLQQFRVADALLFAAVALSLAALAHYIVIGADRIRLTQASR